MNRRATAREVFVRPLSVNRLMVPDGATQLPPLNQWVNRLEVLSSSGKRYVIAQHRDKRHWACDCRGWTTHRTCKHLRELGLPGYEAPYEVVIHAEGAFVAVSASVGIAEAPSASVTGTSAGREIAGLDEV